MTESRRAARVGATVQSALGSIFREGLRDPRLQAAGLITITGVKVTADLSIATVYVMATEDSPEVQEKMLLGFESATPFLRSEVARRLSLKRSPELRFRTDPAIEKGRRIDAILRDMEGEEP
jgi:ribosome-binding factor A